MIQLPRRSVTRFFIPLIDVLTLLFCIFLLMPLIKATGDGQDSAPAGGNTTAGVDRTKLDTQSKSDKSDEKGSLADRIALERSLRERLRLERLELEQLRKEKVETLQQRLFIRVLEIDADTGKLFNQEGDQRFEIGGQDEVLRLIARHRAESDTRELYYLFLYPRKLTGFPQEGQLKRYESWFKSVAHGFDNPRSTR